MHKVDLSYISGENILDNTVFSCYDLACTTVNDLP